MVAQRETLDSQRNAFVTEVHRGLKFRSRSTILILLNSLIPVGGQIVSVYATIFLPNQPLQPWDIPSRSPRPPSSPRGAAAYDEGIARCPPFGKASFEWDMLKAGMTARAKQKETCDQQGNGIDSNATRMPGFAHGLTD